MNRILSVLVLAAFGGVAVADVPPPPPPKGKKYVSVSNEVVLGKDVTGYVFVEAVGRGPGAPRYTYNKVKLKEGKPKAMPAGGRYTYVTLFAVPQDAAKEFKTDDELGKALFANKVKGAHGLGFTGTAVVPDKLKGDSVKWTTTITAIDDKGIKKKVEGDGYEEPADRPGKKDGKKDSPDDEDGAPSDAPAAAQSARGGVWMAGLAAFVALTLGGFWLAGRARRKV